MKVQQFLKDICIDNVFSLLIEYYNMNIKKDEIESAISTILSLKPTSTYGDGIIVFKSFFDETTEKVYATSSLIYTNNEDEILDYAYFDQDWSDICNYEIVIEDGLNEVLAQAELLHEMLQMGTNIETRKQHIEEYFDDTQYLSEK